MHAACVQLSKAAHVLEHILPTLVAAKAELAFDGAEVHGVLHDLRIVFKAEGHIVDGLQKKFGSLHLQQRVDDADVLSHCQHWNRAPTNWAGRGGSGRATQPL